MLWISGWFHPHPAVLALTAWREGSHSWRSIESLSWCRLAVFQAQTDRFQEFR